MKRNKDGGPRPCKALGTRNTSSKRLAQYRCEKDVLKDGEIHSYLWLIPGMGGRVGIAFVLSDDLIVVQ